MAMVVAWVETEFEKIFREHYERMVRVTRRVLRSDAEAEEVCCDTFLKLFRSGPGVLAGGTVGAWLYRVATRASIDRLRQSKRRGVEEDIGAHAGPEGKDVQDAPGHDPLSLLMRSERIAEVRRTLAELKPEKAQLLLLRHSGFSYQEMASAMQMKPASIGTMLARAEAEFSARFQRRHNLNQRAMRLHRANHPGDAQPPYVGKQDLSLGASTKEGR